MLNKGDYMLMALIDAGFSSAEIASELDIEVYRIEAIHEIMTGVGQKPIPGTSITQLGLPSQIESALKSGDIVSIPDLCSRSARELSGINRIGKVAITAIRVRLAVDQMVLRGDDIEVITALIKSGDLPEWYDRMAFTV